MKKLLMGLLALTILAGAAALSRTGLGGGLNVAAEKRNPWTGLKLNNDPNEFQFAIVSDRTGGHRDKIFSRAVARLNLLQPEFVISVGDLIEGGKKAKAKLEAEWQEFDGYVNQLTMPFFYIPGNHDVGLKDSDALWRERYGRRWFHFVYRDVLFLCLNSDDGAGNNVGNEQVAYAKQALADNKDVRYTLVYIHKPIWTGNVEKNGWGGVEKALADRPYTVFCGHVHRYRKYVRQGRNYYQLATTGGGSKVRGIPYGEFDHIVWVTMKKDGPVFVNILLDSVLPDDLKVPDSEEKGVPSRARKTHPVRGVVYHKGVPLAGAYVTFRPEGAGARAGGADAITDGDGSFTPSSFKAFDGLPEGKFAVAVTLRRPMLLPDGKAGPNLLPEKFASAATSGVVVEVKPGASELKIELD